MKQPYIPDQGVAEAAPPPFHEPKPNPYRPDHGVAEAAPPPFPPPPYQIDQGVAEAPPPPVKPIAWPSIRTIPPLPMSLRGAHVEQPYRWIVQQGVPLEIGDPKAPNLGVSATLVPRSVRLPKVDLELRSGRPLKVRFGSIQTTTPAQIEVDLANATPPLYLEDPETHALLEVRFR